MAYFGCSTWPNKGRWLLILVFCILGVVLTILHSQETGKCVKCTVKDGIEVCEDYQQGQDANWSGLRECSTGWMTATAAAFVACFFLCTVTCFSMCFAATPFAEPPALPLSTSQGTSSNDQRGQKALYIITKVTQSSASRTEPHMSPFSDSQSPATPLTPMPHMIPLTPKSCVTPKSAASNPAARAPPQAAAAAMRGPPADPRRRPSEFTNSPSSRPLSGDGMLGEQAMFAFSDLIAAADASTQRVGPARPRRMPAVSSRADAVGEAVASGRSADVSTPGTRSTLKPSPYFVLGSDTSCSPHVSPTVSPAGARSIPRPYAAMYPNAQEDLMALEPAAASGGPARSAGDVLRSLEQAASDGRTDTYGSQQNAPWPERWLQSSPIRHNMRSALDVYAATQESEVPDAARSDVSPLSAALSGSAVSSYGAETPARVSVEPPEVGDESNMHPDISVHLSGMGDDGAGARDS